MQKRYRLFSRSQRGGKFYCIDNTTGKRESLNTFSREEAERIIAAKNESVRQPELNLQIAKVYIAGSDSGVQTRTWADVFKAIIEIKHAETRERWERASREKPFEFIKAKLVIETKPEHFLAVLKAGTVSTNVHLRKLHNFCLSMNWLPWSILPKAYWPPVRFKEKRSVTLAEHRKLVLNETNAERRAFYELCWHLGGSQGDIATLNADDIDWRHRTISYYRKKTKTPAIQFFAEDVEAILKSLPKQGLLFPYFSRFSSTDRGTYFKRLCEKAGVYGITLHCYRYAWAERARTVGMPERFAQEALGHNSSAVHRAYAKHANVKVPSLEEMEKKLVSIDFKSKTA